MPPDFPCDDNAATSLDMQGAFVYRGCHFLCDASPVADGLYQPHVLYRHGLSGLEHMALPIDTEPYASKAEAVRHAEQQAVRWVHDRTGDGQGRS